LEFNTGLKIGHYNAIDFLGDGSFYLLDVPGHAVGHISGFARVTPDTFVFMGGDVCHFGGMLRPTEWKQIPNTLASPAILDRRFQLPCPCSIFTDMHPLKEVEVKGEAAARKNPFYKVTKMAGSWYSFPEQGE
jgi:hypothetical protein